MYRIVEGASQNISDVRAFIESLEAHQNFFDANAEVFVARAPGRLDVMGGIADYSGSLVLQMPIAEAALVALQIDDSRRLKILSLGAETNERTNFFEMPLAEFESDAKPISYDEARNKFKKNPANNWAAYIAGAFVVLMREKNVAFQKGARILIDSKVPEGKGVSSSAAIEVATMNAIRAAFEIKIAPRELAILCQKVENLIVGAPCGIMDQMSSALGEANQFLQMICQPAEILDARKIPEEVAFWGIDSGVRHSVGAGDYSSVRIGAFIGYRIIAELADLKIRTTGTPNVVAIEDKMWSGYLANITPAEFEKHFAARLPKEISGADFLSKYQGITDTVTEVSPDKFYPVFCPTAHPIYENFRVRQFAQRLNQPMTEENLKALGELMFESHASYTACGLGSTGTDLLVEIARDSKEVFGAKITGGGSGGTVAILGRRGAVAEIQKIADQYAKKTGYQPYIFSGSSDGAAAFNYLKILPKFEKFMARF